MFLKFDGWHLLNTDTFESVNGDFPAENVVDTRGAAWAQHWALARKHAIHQFLHGETREVSLDVTFWKDHLLDMNAERQLSTLLGFLAIDRLFGRPPILEFWIGNSFLSMKCILVAASVKHERPTKLGAMKQARVSLTLQQFEPYDEKELQNFDTRYHIARQGDTYEMLTHREYGDPMLGVEIRKRHPSMPLAPTIGSVVKLPSVQGVRRVRIAPSSIPFAHLEARSSKERSLFASVLAARSLSKFSTVLAA